MCHPLHFPLKKQKQKQKQKKQATSDLQDNLYIIFAVAQV